MRELCVFTDLDWHPYFLGLQHPRLRREDWGQLSWALGIRARIFFFHLEGNKNLLSFDPKGNDRI